MHPLDALQRLLLLPLISSRDIRGPGKVVEIAGCETREALSRLTSDELARMRVEKWEMNDEWSFQARVNRARQQGMG